MYDLSYSDAVELRDAGTYKSSGGSPITTFSLISGKTVARRRVPEPGITVNTRYGQAIPAIPACDPANRRPESSLTPRSDLR